MYDDFYKLTGRPFQLTPDPDFYFESGTHRKALSYLGYGLAQGEGFIVITGAIGAGKSTLAAHLMATIDRQRLTAAQIVTSRLDGEELVHLAARAFGIDVQGHDKATALALIENFLQDEARAGRRCLLVVDEAQNLSVDALEELRMLSNFQLGAHPLLQILLLGQPEFRELLQGSPALEQLRQRVIASHHLDAMEPGEVGPYVEHRLTRVGWRGNPAFAANVYAALAKASGGLPRRINQIVTRVLLMGAVEQRTTIDAAMLSEVLADLGRDTAVMPGGNAGPAALAQTIQAAGAAGGAASSGSVPAREAQAARKDPAIGAHAAAPFSDPGAALAGFAAALAVRDEQIAELQRAVIELADMPGAPTADLSDIVRRLDALEARSTEQDKAVRHILTMLIEWIENENPRRAA
ncbi:XrtA/PEP-CTERM system-associated ATPase [Novosphingobium sp. Chol11]|uniref:XrtA/PEP-CTERM system-associated ATPase n=1 Tax=Novosphingobium sp. Chol11 TaxID=1385763 RepID=UPI0025FA77AC|nr:XrtA/PEP-CTERM system-associated ATPase [Novosphingobium sp. Chol11]